MGELVSDHPVGREFGRVGVLGSAAQLNQCRFSRQDLSCRSGRHHRLELLLQEGFGIQLAQPVRTRLDGARVPGPDRGQ